MLQADWKEPLQIGGMLTPQLMTPPTPSPSRSSGASSGSNTLPKGLMKLKKQELLALKQGAMSVSEYRDKFIQLSCYAPVEVADDEEKQDHFRDGLIGPIKYQLMVHTFENFQKMVNNAIMVEHAHKEMGQQKRKFESSGQFSNNSRPHFAPPQGTPFHTGGQSVNYGQNQYQWPNQ
jgi:hypothetical protein